MKVDKQGGVLRSYIVFALGRILPLTCFSVMPSAFIVLPLKINVLFIIIFIYKHSQETFFFLVLVSRIIAFFRVVIVFYLRNIMNHVNNLGFCFCFLATGELRAKSVVCTSLISGLILCSFHFCSLIYFEHLLLVYFRYPCRLSQITSGISLMCTWAVHCPLFPHL